MKRLIISLCLLLSFERLNALCSCQEIGNVAFEAEWIYFRPSIDTNFVTQSEGAGLTSVNKTVEVVPPYHSGWRAGIAYQFCDCLDTLFVRWTQLRTRDTRHFIGASFNSLAGGISEPPGVSAKDRLEFSYYALEGLIAHRLMQGCGYFLELAAGAQYAWVGVSEHVQLSTLPGADIPGRQLAKQNGHFWGVGPEIGLNLGIPFCGNFLLVMEGSASLLVSRVHAKAQGTTPLFVINQLVSRPIWRIVPSWDLRAGTRYECPFRCFNIYVEAGYEVLSYFRGLRLLNLTSSTTTFDYSNADMHGPYVNAGIIF
jgi:hypothetical protein